MRSVGGIIWEIMNNLRFHPYGDGRGLSIVGIVLIVLAVAALVAGLVIFLMIVVLRQWHKKDAEPRISEDAVCIGKRAFSGRGPAAVDGVLYFAAFRFADGRQAEFSVSRNQHGLLAEGMQGKLTHAGDRYLDFQQYQYPQFPQYPQYPSGPYRQ